MDDNEIETRALTFKQLAELLGIQWDSARKLVRRMKWRKVQGNELANLIMVPVDFLIERGVMDAETRELALSVFAEEFGPPNDPGSQPPTALDLASDEDEVESQSIEPEPEASNHQVAARIVMAQLLEQVAALRELVESERRRAEAQEQRAEAESSRAEAERERAVAAEQDRDRWHGAWTEASKPWWLRGRKVA